MSELERLKSWEEILSEKLDWPIFCYSSLESTMDAARKVANQCTIEKAVLVVAAQQTNGRGRLGRSWSAAKSGVFCTYVFSCKGCVAASSGFSLVVGVALLEVLTEFNCKLGLKWPNDLLASDGRKIAGVLIESYEAQGAQHVLVGIGINLSGAPRDIPHSASLEDICGRTIAPLEILERLSPKLLEYWLQFEQEGFAPFKSSWERNAMYIGEEVTTHPGEEAVQGRFVGIDQDGALLLETQAGKRRIVSGDVIR